MGVMEARRRILLNQPHLIDASGNPISFSTDMAAKMGVKAHFSPVQEGSGDPSPSNVRPITGWTGLTAYRTGKNLFSGVPTIESAYIDGSGKIAAHNSYNLYAVPIVPNHDYTLSQVGVDGYPIIGFIEKYPMIGDQTNSYESIRFIATKTYSVGSNTYMLLALYKTDTNGKQVELGSTATTYEPYSGSSYPVTFPVVGKNLFDVNGDLSPLYARAGNMSDASSVFSVVNGAITYGVAPDSSYGRMFKIGYCKTGTYTLSLNWNGAMASGRWNLLGYDNQIEIGKAPSYITIKNSLEFSVATTTFTLSSAKYVYVLLSDTTYNNAITISDIQLESGSTATSYEPFTNTLYGGYVDYERGEVVAEWEMASAKWGDIRNQVSGHSEFYSANIYFNNPVVPSHSTSDYGKNAIANCVSRVSWQTSSDLTDHFFVSSPSAGQPYVYVMLSDTVGADDIVQVAAKLATPIHYPITPTLIKSLKGANTIWSEMNGNLQISYWKH